MHFKRAATSVFFLFCILITYVNSQISTGDLSGQINVIHVAVPFLTIAPDSRSGAMGETGIATEPDVNSMHWNASKYIFAKEKMGAAISYTPWLRNLIDDINLAYVSYYTKLDQNQAIAFSLLYFSLGNIVFTNLAGQPDGQHSPNEFAVDAAYSRRFSDNLSGGLAFRYIRSDLTGGTYVGGLRSRSAQAFAADVSAYYFKDLTIADKDSRLAFGLNIANIGNKITYSENQNSQYIPITLKIGTAWIVEIDNFNTITLAADFNKLLVPTPPIYGVDQDTGEQTIIAGKDPNVPVALGMLQSLYDAPGGFKEELREITIGIGAEYWYYDQFALRAGYFHEHETKGNRKFFTTGMGVKFNIFTLDFSYLVPVFRNNPLANTLRFTLAFDFQSPGRPRNPRTGI